MDKIWLNQISAGPRAGGDHGKQLRIDRTACDEAFRPRSQAFKFMGKSRSTFAQGTGSDRIRGLAQAQGDGGGDGSR